MAAYCAALQTEIRLMARRYGDMPVDTVFLGGGTPSIVPATLMEQVLATLRESFTLLPNAEFTVEANPGTLTDPWLEALTRAGMNRLSLGVQAGQERLLRLLGRIHDYPQALDAFAMARKHGVTNINADAMFGLPTQTAHEYEATLRMLAQAGVTHISAYSLILEEGTLLHEQVQSGHVTLPDEDETADMLENGITLLEALRYPRYEISNFAKAGFECRHNLGYWQQKPYVGLGLAAASLLPDRPEGSDARYTRKQNAEGMTAYIAALSHGELPPAEHTLIGLREAMFETVMLGLRTVEGIEYEAFAAMYGRGLTDVYGRAIAELTSNGLLIPTDTAHPRLALTRRGLAVQNMALQAFLREQ